MSDIEKEKEAGMSFGLRVSEVLMPGLSQRRRGNGLAWLLRLQDKRPWQVVHRLCTREWKFDFVVDDGNLSHGNV